MTIFNLPDLGEGLLEAEIHEWYVKEGDTVNQDQPLVAMETAKAVVDVPAPQTGIIKKIYGECGSIIRTGSPLIEFEATETSSTVVGKLEEKADMVLNHLEAQMQHPRPKATLATRRLANQLGVKLEEVKPTGELGLITAEDVSTLAKSKPQGQSETLRGVRRQMALAMESSHQQVVPVTIYDEADISHWQKPYDISVNLIEAIQAAIQVEPGLNSWFNGQERTLFQALNLGLAMDNQDGLFVPVIHDTQSYNRMALREKINALKEQVQARSLPPEAFQNATFTLSNFGKFAGKFASPIVVPPMVAILAVGRLFQVPGLDLKPKDKLPLSLSFDHRAITGGEATRFLGALIQYLEHH
jgi:2-oxoisovalerate dehydrogenase E2 component (dihydrolipoyl transacylase)